MSPAVVGVFAVSEHIVLAVSADEPAGKGRAALVKEVEGFLRVGKVGEVVSEEDYAVRAQLVYHAERVLKCHEV